DHARLAQLQVKIFNNAVEQDSFFNRVADRLQQGAASLTARFKSAPEADLALIPADSNSGLSFKERVETIRLQKEVETAKKVYSQAYEERVQQTYKMLRDIGISEEKAMRMARQAVSDEVSSGLWSPK